MSGSIASISAAASVRSPQKPCAVADPDRSGHGSPGRREQGSGFSVEQIDFQVPSWRCEAVLHLQHSRVKRAPGRLFPEACAWRPRATVAFRAER